VTEDQIPANDKGRGPRDDPLPRKKGADDDIEKDEPRRRPEPNKKPDDDGGGDGDDDHSKRYKKSKKNQKHKEAKKNKKGRKDPFGDDDSGAVARLTLIPLFHQSAARAGNQDRVASGSHLRSTFGNNQCTIRQIVAEASGRGSKRMTRLRAITNAKDPTELKHVARKCRGLDQKLAFAALVACEGHPVLHSLDVKARRPIVEWNCLMGDSRCGISTTDSRRPTWQVLDLRFSSRLST
jgi:hypothetical protein